MSLLDELRALAEHTLRGRPPAHDFSHVERVAALAETLARAEGADVETVVVASLLHEQVNLPKDHASSIRSGDLCAEAVEEALAARGVRADLVARVAGCIREHSFSKGARPTTLEAAVVQDADRLDAIGAVGIARLFATSTEMGVPFFSPDDPLCRRRTPDDRRWGVDHFHRKLLRIPGALHTPTARRLAVRREATMRAFLEALGEELGA